MAPHSYSSLTPRPLLPGDIRDQLRSEPLLLSAIEEPGEVVQVGAGAHSTLRRCWCTQGPVGAEHPCTAHGVGTRQDACDRACLHARSPCLLSFHSSPERKRQDRGC